MKTNTLLTIYLLVFLVGIALGSVINPKQENTAYLVKTWNVNEFTASSTIIDNGLYSAIEKCHEKGGVTGLEGSGKQWLTCYKDTTYIYADWKWVYWNF